MNNPESALLPLSQRFSSARMSRYAAHPTPEALYLWNTHLTKTYLADIEHLEVLLRNCIHTALTRRYDERWFDNHRINFSSEAAKSIHKAMKRAGGRKAPPGKIIAELSFDFWRVLLSSHYQARHLAADRKGIEGKTRRQTAIRRTCSHYLQNEKQVLSPRINRPTTQYPW